MAVSCLTTFESQNSLGEVKSAGTGAISSFAVSRGAGREKCVPANVEHNWCKAVESTKGLNLPWKTELYTEGSEIRAMIVNGGAGTPIWDFECENQLVRYGDDCWVSSSTHESNNVLGGLVEAAFDTKSPKTKCERGSHKDEAGEWKGVMKAKPTAAEKEKGVEAIKVE
jgi:hypothetical protein